MNLTMQQIFDAAVKHHEAGRLTEAQELYRQVLSQNAQHADALHLLGVLAGQCGRNDIATDFIQRALAVRPVFPDAYYHLGLAHRNHGQTKQAIAAWRQAIGQEANFPLAQLSLAIALRQQGQLKEAVSAYRQGIALLPGYPQAHYNLGIALHEMSRFEEAVAAYDEALVLNPLYVEALTNRGNSLLKLNRVDDAIDSCKRAIALQSDCADAHYNLAMSYFLKGELALGWNHHEWRSKLADSKSQSRRFMQPLWEGHDLKGKSLLLHAEQGFGDTIQFLRYLPIAAKYNGRLVVEVQKELLTLVREVSSTTQWIVRGEELPQFDVHCPLLTLPMIFRTTLTTIPRLLPFRPPAALTVMWRKKVRKLPDKLNVALTWAGNPFHKNDSNRSMQLEQLAVLGHLPGCEFYSVQMGAAAAQAVSPPKGLRLIDLSPELHDFVDTAAALTSMDLVICVDTSVAHLAGSIGSQVWVLLPFAPDWRWLVDREDSSWYPTMRLFRQIRPGDWTNVMERVAQALTVYRDQSLGTR